MIKTALLKIAKSSNVKKRLREASGESFFNHSLSRGSHNAADNHGGMRKNRILDMNSGNEEKRRLDLRGRHSTNYSGGLSGGELAGFKSNILNSRTHSSRQFAEAAKNFSADDKEQVANMRADKKRLVSERKNQSDATAASVGRKKLIGGSYVSPKEQWKSKNNPPKPKFNFFGEPLDANAPKTTLK